MSESPEVQRHEKYYFDDGNIVFQAEATLFKIHRYFFQRDSPVFQEMLSRPSATSGEGESDDKPIVLERVNSADFACFLACLYPINYGYGDLTSYDEWAAALELAVLWEFARVRDFIVKRLKETGTLAEQIATARRLDMHDWCWDVCTAICQRPEPLKIEEGRRLGLEDTVRISEVREKLRVCRRCHNVFHDWADPAALVQSPKAINSVKTALRLPCVPVDTWSDIYIE